MRFVIINCQCLISEYSEIVPIESFEIKKQLHEASSRGDLARSRPRMNVSQHESDSGYR